MPLGAGGATLALLPPSTVSPEPPEPEPSTLRPELPELPEPSTVSPEPPVVV